MYIDTSAFVKLYVGEPDSEACEAMVLGNTLVSSRLLYCEFNSALLAKQSRGTISAEIRVEIWREFEMDIAARNIQFISLNDLLLQEATELMTELHSRVPLRTLDAIHLATYLSVETGPIFTRDRRMLQAAAHLGLPLAG
jgi:predicted nucleic acid-binding protein